MSHQGAKEDDVVFGLLAVDKIDRELIDAFRHLDAAGSRDLSV
jgi:hypothetical protein